jgi:hypothetical protein
MFPLARSFLEQHGSSADVPAELLDGLSVYGSQLNQQVEGYIY